MDITEQTKNLYNWFDNLENAKPCFDCSSCWGYKCLKFNLIVNKYDKGVDCFESFSE